MVLLKAPLRITGSFIATAGLVFKAVGGGICKVGNAIRPESHSQWVPAPDDAIDGESLNFRGATDASAKLKMLTEKTTVNMSIKKMDRDWSDDASAASTDVGSDLPGKAEKDFG